MKRDTKGKTPSHASAKSKAWVDFKPKALPDVPLLPAGASFVGRSWRSDAARPRPSGSALVEPDGDSHAVANAVAQPVDSTPISHEEVR